MGLLVRPVYQDATLPTVGETELTAFGCDVCFVSDDSTPAESLVTAAAEQCDSPPCKESLWRIFERLRAEYDAGEMVPNPSRVLAIIREMISAEPSPGLFDVCDRVNRALFQHQTLSWLAGNDFSVRIYGVGWQEHPQFAKLAHGPIESEAKWQAICRASGINLAAGVYGAVSPRVMDGIAAGGFFLMRFCPADVIERFYPPIAEFCARYQITTNEELADLAKPGIRQLLDFASRTLEMDVLRDWPDFVPHMLSAVQSAAPPTSPSAAAVWPSYPAVAFSSRDQLLGMCTRYLYDTPERKRLAEQMRHELADFTNRVSVSVNRQLLSEMSGQEDLRSPLGAEREVAA